ncbi:MAG: hypothetical protein KAJ63_01565 [Methyloprofundus sp.]|nr:hypothetical protein [Methyloprofundus sp.]
MLKRIQISFLITLLLIPLSGIYAKEEPAAIETTVLVVDTVVDFDKDSRILTLRNKQGEESTFTLGPEVQNLDEIKRDDQLLVQYFNAFAILLGPKNTELKEQTLQTQPSVKTTRSITAVGTVKEIDQQNSLLTVQGGGEALVVNVAEHFDLSGIMLGDEVEVVYIESYAIKVVPAAKILGTVSIESTSIAIGIGYEWGQGELTMYDGSTYTFDIQGISMLDVGISLLEAEGSVYRVIEPKDMEGKYWAAEIGISYGNGVSAVTMKNRNDVIMHLTSKQKGMKLKLAAEGIKITNIMPKVP